MTTPTTTRTKFASPGLAGLPTPPSGWPVGSYATYAGAQRAVDYLADNDFPVRHVTIVGVDPMVVERVTARLTWARVLAGGAASGAWLGLWVGLLLALFSTGDFFTPLLIGLVTGALFGMAFAAAGYASLRGQRDFTSTTQIVATRYDVLSEPPHAEQAKALLAQLEAGSPS
ncbi:MAG TPA: general stress protein [Actinophytocola sp.]|uniref:general stress protein n=1 Tax=Actinophytocola sp. TaxID=1872138 RepID=UPI002DB6D738|nr:general stress protein [Actinophytocola sp.]HEU5470457.1 general stress protein [Actinophytocola sp.]